MLKFKKYSLLIVSLNSFSAELQMSICAAFLCGLIPWSAADGTSLLKGLFGLLEYVLTEIIAVLFFEPVLFLLEQLLNSCSWRTWTWNAGM